MEKMAHFIPFKNSKKNWISPEIISIVLILLLGFFLRIYNIKRFIVFLGDEGRDVLVVWEILNGNLTLLGPTASVGGFFLGPVYYYLMAPFLWIFNYDPVGPAVMVVLFGVATIYLVYKLGKEFFGKYAGLTASLLYAVSPIVIIYSRSSWNPNVFPFFTISSLYSLYLGVKRKKWWLFVLSGLLMGINLQIHYLATFVGAIMFIYVTFVDFSPRVSWIKLTLKRYLLMILGFLVGFSPFIAFELRHSFSNSLNIARFILDSPDTGFSGNLFLNLRIVFERLFGGVAFSFPDNAKKELFNPSILEIWYMASILLGVFLIGFFLYYFYKNINDRKTFHKTFLIFIWIFVGIGLFLFYKKSVFDYYLGFLYPIPFILIGLVVSQIIKKHKKPGIIIVGVFVGILLLLSLKFTPISGTGNSQANQMKIVSEFVLSKTEGRPYNFSLSGDGNSDHAYRYFFRLADMDPVGILGLDVDPDRTSVTDQLFVICEQKPCSPLGESGQEIAGFGRAEIAEEWEVSVIKVFKLIHYQGEE